MSFLWALLFRLLGLSPRMSRAEALRRGGLEELAAFEAELAFAADADLRGAYGDWAEETMRFLERVAFAHAPHRFKARLASTATIAALRARCAAVRRALGLAPKKQRAPHRVAHDRAPSAPRCLRRALKLSG